MNQTNQPESEFEEATSRRQKQTKIIRIFLVLFVGYTIFLALFIGPSSHSDYTLIQMSHKPNIDYVTSMAFDEGYDVVYIGTMSALWKYHIWNQTIQGPFEIDNNTYFSGCHDLSLPMKLWSPEIAIATRSGLRLFDISSNTGFEPYWASDYSDSVLRAIEHHPLRNYLFFGGEGTGLIVRNESESPYTIFSVNSSMGLANDWVTSLAVAENYVFTGSSGGFSVYDIDLNEVKWTQTTKPNGEWLSIRCLEYSNQKLYVGTEDGLYIYSIDIDGIEFQRTVGHSDGLAGPAIYSMKMDVDNHKLYLGTNGGLSFFDTQSEEVKTIEQTTEIHRPFIEAIEFHNYGPFHYVYFGTFDNQFFSLNLDFAKLNIDEQGFPETPMGWGYAALGVILVIGAPIVWSLKGYSSGGFPIGPKDELGARRIVAELMSRDCKKYVWIIDRYVDPDTLPFLRDATAGDVRLLAEKIYDERKFKSHAKALYRDRADVQIRQSKSLWTHQRYLLTDGKGWDLGSSLNRIGSRQTRISPLNTHEYQEAMKEFKKEWSKSSKVIEGAPRKDFQNESRRLS